MGFAFPSGEGAARRRRKRLGQYRSSEELHAMLQVRNLFSHGFAVPASPEGKPFGSAQSNRYTAVITQAE